MTHYTLATYLKNKPIDCVETHDSDDETEFSPDDAFDILEELLGVENVGYIAVVDAVIKLKEEMKKVKDCLVTTEMEQIADANAHREEIKKLKATCLQWQERADFNLSDIDDSNFDSEEENDENHKSLDSGWFEAYGFKHDGSNITFNMCGGCSEWFDYVVNKRGCWISNKDGMSQVRGFAATNDCKYFHAIKLDDPPYTFGDDETDVMETIANCYTLGNQCH